MRAKSQSGVSVFQKFHIVVCTACVTFQFITLSLTLNTTTNASKSKITASVNPLNATPSDTYSFLEEFDEEFEN